MMTSSEFQTWLNNRGACVTVDGKCGPATRLAIIEVFTNLQAPAITPDEVAAFAKRLNVSVRQMNAVAKVESAGGGFDDKGRPKILFERHYFWRLTEGRFGVTPWSNPSGGGYGESSWEKLTQAACRDPDAAFASASWGKFQVMGAHWKTLDYPSSLAMAYTTRQSEADHYEMLTRFIEANKLQVKMAAISTNPADCTAFARAYNGPAQKGYDQRLAAAMR